VSDADALYAKARWLGPLAGAVVLLRMALGRRSSGQRQRRGRQQQWQG
jgi:hypothetical protein